MKMQQGTLVRVGRGLDRRTKEPVRLVPLPLEHFDPSAGTKLAVVLRFRELSLGVLGVDVCQV